MPRPKFKEEQVVFDSHYGVVVKMLDYEEGILIDELARPLPNVIIINCDKSEIATQEQIEKAFNEETTQWDRLCHTPGFQFV